MRNEQTLQHILEVVGGSEWFIDEHKALLRVARAARSAHPPMSDGKAGEWCVTCWTNMGGLRELKEALKELPEGLLDE